MKNYLVRQYQQNDYKEWNSFIGKAKNATFLFYRDFMEYHKAQFEDFSLLVYENQKLIAVLPANQISDRVFSHLGLTYGGLVYGEKTRLATVLIIFRTILLFLKDQKIETLELKMLPGFYADFHAEEINYILFLAQAKLIRRDTFAVIALQKKFLIAKGRMEGVAKGIKMDLIIKEESNFEMFWNQILIPNLEKAHHAKPVHTLVEIKNLHQKFPSNIRQFNVYYKEKIVAGTTIFETKNVAHAQYISGNSDKNILGSVDFLYHHLITSVFKNKAYFDFGTSTINQGTNLNDGLSYWKESFGANIAVQDFYELATTNSHLLENVLI